MLKLGENETASVVRNRAAAFDFDRFFTLDMLAQLDAEISPRRGRKLGAKGR